MRYVCVFICFLLWLIFTLLLSFTVIGLVISVSDEWRINSVWHDAREKPDKGKLLIVEDIDGAYDLVYSTKSKPWEELSEKDHYMRWAYIEDLLPCEEERG